MVQRHAHGGFSYGVLLCCVYQYQYILGDRLDRCPMLEPPKSQKLPIQQLTHTTQSEYMLVHTTNIYVTHQDLLHHHFLCTFNTN